MWIPGLPVPPESDPRDGMRGAWASGAAPREMLAALRVELGDVPAPDQARRLVDFAHRSARQLVGAPGRLADSGDDGSGSLEERELVQRLLTAGERRVRGELPEEERRAVRQLAAHMARRAAGRLMEPAHRRRAAAVLAAFNALDQDAYTAALLASGMAERHGARNEREARLLRARQAAWLHELFGHAILADPPPPEPVQGEWEDTGRCVPDQAASMRYLRRHRAALLALDPWIPVPQGACSYTFGPAERPLPIGALYLLWDGWPAMTGECPECGGEAVGYAMGGMSRTGGVLGCCLTCERELRREVGGLATVREAMRPLLEGTGFEVAGVRDYREGAVVGRGEELEAAVEVVAAGEVLGGG